MLPVVQISLDLTDIGEAGVAAEFSSRTRRPFLAASPAAIQRTTRPMNQTSQLRGGARIFAGGRS